MRTPQVIPSACPVCGRDDAQLAGAFADEQEILCPRCGLFSILNSTIRIIERQLSDQRHLLAYAVRAATEGKESVILTNDNVFQFISSAPRWRTIDEGVDRFLLAIEKRAKTYTQQLEIEPKTDYVLVPVTNEVAFSDLLGLAHEMQYFDRNTKRITVQGWRRLEGLRTIASGRRQAFVAMWFAPEMSDAWSNGLKPGIEASNYYTALRIDAKEHNNKIDDEIVAEIRRSGLVVADFTGDRGGVYFEAGFAAGLGIPLIRSCRADFLDKLHFDTNHFNHIVWESPDELRERLDKRIRATVLPADHLRASA